MYPTGLGGQLQDLKTSNPCANLDLENSDRHKMAIYYNLILVIGVAVFSLAACSSNYAPTGQGFPQINTYGLPEVQLEPNELGEGNSCNPVRYRYFSGVEMNYQEHYEDCYFPPTQTFLSLSFPQNSNLKMLDGLSNYPSLKALEITGWNFSNIEALSQLRNLESLQLGSSHPYVQGAENLDSISELTKLRELDFSFVRTLVNIDGVQNLHALEELNLYSTSVSDISALSDLRKLKFLNLEDTLVSNIAPLSGHTALVSLNISNTEVRDLTAISTMPKLSRLVLFESSFQDLSPLKGAVSLEYVGIEGNQFPFSDRIVDLSGLLNLPNLKEVVIDPAHAPAEQIARLRLKGVKIGLGVIQF
jgi:hypothetical protein